MYKLNILDKISLVLLIIGSINWGLIGLFNFNLVGSIFGEPANLVGRIIYILIGVAGVNIISFLFKIKKYSK